MTSLPIDSAIDLSTLTKAEILALTHDWEAWARPSQLPPDNPNSSNYLPNQLWDYWIVLAGRGFGKTRIAMEQVLRWVDQGYRRIAIISPTTADTRDVVAEGESGLMNIAHPRKRPLYEPSKRRLTFPNGAIATLYSAEEPERLRGPQFDAAIFDEVAAYQYPQEVWDMLHFGLRLGAHPQVVVSTTPKPIPLIRNLIERSKKDAAIVLTRGSTYDNKANLAPTFFKQVVQYEGTRLGRQELHAELIDPKDSGIVQQKWLHLYPHALQLPVFEHIVQSYDTAFTEKTMDRKTKDPDPSAASTWGVFRISEPLRQTLQTLPTPINLPSHVTHGVMLLDAWSDHLGFPDLRARVQKEYSNSMYGPKDDLRRADIVLIEDKGSGISLRQDLSSTVPIFPYNPGRADKIERLHAVSHIPCQGMVFIPESQRHPGQAVTWAQPLLEQLCCFPLVENDDYVDTTSQAWRYLKDIGFLVVDDIPVEEEFYNPRTARNPYLQ